MRPTYCTTTEELRHQIFTKIYIPEGKNEIIFEKENGDYYRASSEKATILLDISEVKSLKKLQDYPITRFQETVFDGQEPNITLDMDLSTSIDDSFTFTSYRIGNESVLFDIWWFASGDGYSSEKVDIDFYRVAPLEKTK